MYCHALLLILRLRADNVTACPTHFAERTLWNVKYIDINLKIQSELI
jgi:hypothetical protein